MPINRLAVVGLKVLVLAPAPLMTGRLRVKLSALVTFIVAPETAKPVGARTKVRPTPAAATLPRSMVTLAAARPPMLFVPAKVTEVSLCSWSVPPSVSESGFAFPEVSAERTVETPAVVLETLACNWSLAPLPMTVSPLALAGRPPLLPERMTVPPLAANVKEPAKVLLPNNSRVPFPALMKPVPVTVPPIVKVPAVTVRVLALGIVTVPVPKLRLFVPTKAKSPATWIGLLPVNVRAPATASSEPPAKVIVPLPRPLSWPRLSKPAAKTVPPE